MYIECEHGMFYQILLPLYGSECHNINIVCTRKTEYSIIEEDGKAEFAFGLICFAFSLRNFGGVSR